MNDPVTWKFYYLLSHLYRVLRRVLGPKRDEVTGNGENYIMRRLVISTPYPILCRW